MNGSLPLNPVIYCQFSLASIIKAWKTNLKFLSLRISCASLLVFSWAYLYFCGLLSCYGLSHWEVGQLATGLMASVSLHMCVKFLW